MYTPYINANQQTHDIFYDIFVCLQVIVHYEYMTYVSCSGGNRWSQYVLNLYFWGALGCYLGVENWWL